MGDFGLVRGLLSSHSADIWSHVVRGVACIDHYTRQAGFMYSMEKSVWYHQGTEFGRRKAENEEKSVEKLVSYLEELRSGGRGAGLNNGLVLLFECAEDFGLVRGLLSSHSADRQGAHLRFLQPVVLLPQHEYHYDKPRREPGAPETVAAPPEPR